MVTSAQLRGGPKPVKLDRERFGGQGWVFIAIPLVARKPTRPSTAMQVAQMVRTLEAAGVEFTNGGQPGVRNRGQLG